MKQDAAKPDESAVQEWSLGWKLVLAAMIGFSFHSVMSAAAGLFIGPLSAEFGWNRTQASMGVSIAAVSTTLLSPFFGVLIDRWGSRRIALPGLVIAGLAVSSFSLANGVIWQWVALWTFYAFASLLVKSTVWAAAVSSVFTTARGFALGVTMAGASAAQIITPLFANYVIDHYGWRAAYVAIGLGWGGVAFIFSALFLYDARDRVKKAHAVSQEQAAPAPALPGLSIQQAWRDISLWKVAISTLIIMTMTMAILVHQFPILTEAGVSRQNAAYLAALAGVAGILGKLSTGWFMDFWHGRWVAGVVLVLSSLTFVFLLEPIRTPLLIAVAMFINGFAAGTKLQVCGYLTTRYAGLKNFGAIFGFMASAIALGSGLGPVLGGLAYDAYGDYTPLLLAGIVACLLSGGIMFSLGPYPDWKRAAPAES